MSSLIPLPTASLDLIPTRQTRAAGRQIVRMQAHTELRIRNIENESDVQAAKIDALGHVAKRAQWVVAEVTQSEQQLAQLVPLATTRLEAIGDAATLAAVEILSELRNQVRHA